MDVLTEYAGGHLNPFTGVDATKNFAILKNTWQASLDKDTFFCEYDALEDKISKIHSGLTTEVTPDSIAVKILSALIISTAAIPSVKV